MNQLFAAAAAVALSLLLLGLGRRPKPILRSTDAKNVADLNRAQLTLVQPIKDRLDQDLCAANQVRSSWQPPSTPLERIDLQRQLNQAMVAGPEERLQAIMLSSLWGHASVLPLLRRGLRDADSRVVIAAAAALGPYRGAPRAQKSQLASPPRNVARMR
jgi:hypothetical protein